MTMKFSSCALWALLVLASVDGFSKSCLPRSRLRTAIFGYQYNNNSGSNPMDAYQRAMRELNNGYSTPDWERKFGDQRSLRDGKLEAQYGYDRYASGGPTSANRFNGGVAPELTPLIPDQDDRAVRTSSIFPPSDAATRTRGTLNGQTFGEPPQTRPRYSIYYEPEPPQQGRGRMPRQPTSQTNIFGQKVEPAQQPLPYQGGYTPRALPQSSSQYVPRLDNNKDYLKKQRRTNGSRSNQFNRDNFSIGSNNNNDRRTTTPRRNGLNGNRFRDSSDLRSNSIFPKSDSTAERIELRNQALANRYGNGSVRQPTNFTSNSAISGGGSFNANRQNNSLIVEPANGRRDNDYIPDRNMNRNGFNNNINPLGRDATYNARINRNYNRKQSNRRINSIGKRPPDNDGVPRDVSFQQWQRNQRNIGSNNRNGVLPPRNGGNAPPRDRMEPLRLDNPLNVEGYTSTGPALGRPNGIGGTSSQYNSNGMNSQYTTPTSRRAAAAAGYGSAEEMEYDYYERRRLERRRGKQGGGFGAAAAAAFFIGVPLTFLVGPEYLDKYPALRDNTPKSVREFSKDVQKSLKNLEFSMPKPNFPTNGALKDKIKNNNNANNKDVKKPAPATSNAAPKPAVAAPKPAPAPAPKLTAEEIERQLKALEAPPPAAAAPKPPPAPVPAPAAPKKLTPEEILKQLDEVKVGYPSVDNTQQQYADAYNSYVTGGGTAASQPQYDYTQQQYTDAYNSFVSMDNAQPQHSQPEQQQYSDAYNGYVSTDHTQHQQQQHQDAYTSYMSAQSAQEQQQSDAYNGYVSTDNTQQQHQHQQVDYTQQQFASADYTQHQQQQHLDAHTNYMSAESAQEQQQSMDPSYWQGQDPHQEYQQGGSNNFWTAGDGSQQQYQDGYDDYSMF